MSIKAVLFDLDGTLLPMDQEVFIKAYFKGLAKRMMPYGYDPEKLPKSIMEGTVCMIKNDGTKTNEEVFWEKFAQIYGEESLKNKPIIDDYYINEFAKVQEVCGFSLKAKQVVELVKAHGYIPILATNPIFPSIATQNRTKWAGLDIDDFAYFSTYENSHYSKPNKKYYLEILEKFGLKTTECLMVGNDMTDDILPATTLGMKVFVLTDHLINTWIDVSVYPHGNFDDLINYINNL